MESDEISMKKPEVLRLLVFKNLFMVRLWCV